MTEDIFIDAEQNYGNNKDSYDDMILKQMQRCVDNLSKEIKGGIYKRTKQGDIYEEDVRELIINSIDVLEGMMGGFIKGEFEEQINKEHDEINKIYEEIGDQYVEMKGGKKVQVKTLGRLPPDSPILLRFKDFKADIYRQIFKILVRCYQKNKQDIMAMSYE